MFSLGRDKFNLFSTQHLFSWSTISHIVGYWSFNRNALVLKSNMRRSSQVFRQAFNSPKNATGLDFGGSFGQHHIDRKDSLASVTNAELHEHVSRTWQMDDISTQLHNYTMEENICERHFLDNVSQNSQGRYIVKLPVRKQMLNNIGDSRESALKRLIIERRFKRDPILKIQYAVSRRIFIAGTHATHGVTHCGKNNIILSSPPLRLQNGRASKNPCCIRCILPQ